MDTHQNGSLSQIDIIKGCRSNPRVRDLLGLPEKIRQEDGTRDAFEEVFHAMDASGEKKVNFDSFLHFTAELAGVVYDDMAPGSAGNGDGNLLDNGALAITNGSLEIENGLVAIEA
jgi:hypothetical protein